MTFDPNGTGKALYYTTFNNGGEVRRIVYAGGNRAPVADLKAPPPYGESSSDLTINFDASGSSDPEGDTPLTYLWNFGDGATATTATPTTDHTYASAGNYTVTLTVRDSLG
jgi:PKD repeat protein